MIRTRNWKVTWGKSKKRFDKRSLPQQIHFSLWQNFWKICGLVRPKTLKNPWITKAKAIWYFLKSKTYEHEISYKTYCKLFELVKQIAKHLILNIRNIFDSKIIANSFNKYFANWTERSFEMYLKGKLMQIWKSANIFVFIWK